ncbi:hypothetical protein AK812_SmicGene27352 [Symbiodinium microadriaticum]|uniref:Hint domain-containing protein n=1 Tax=Symbiodinium microadriaticum TaxID=2951 RepID=A0A1Q9D796_SYMMI|nr:hypothetical protein AK812_SmicGene27352 [Symbiodinium microadriaticum]
MPQQSDAKRLVELTEVPAGWPLATVIDAFAYVAAYHPLNPSYIHATRACEAVSRRLVDLWASQPAEAQAWRELHAKEATGPEELQEALLRYGAAEFGQYGSCDYRFCEAGLLRGKPRGSAAREELAAEYLQSPFARNRCRELTERLAQAESRETARKRQKLEEEEGRELSNRLAAAEAEVSVKTAELQTAQKESAKCKERCAAAESATAEMQKELRQMQEEHSKCQERCQDLANRLQAAEAEHAEAKKYLVHDAIAKQMQPQQPQVESCSHQAGCFPFSAEDGGSKAELQLEKAVLQERCEQLRQQLAKAEAKVDLLQGLREEIGMYKERLRGPERRLCETKKSRRLCGGISGDPSQSYPGPARHDIAFGDQKSDLAEQLGYSLVDEDGASVTIASSGYVVKENCFMLDAIFKSRMDFFREGRDLQKGSQVLAGDGKTVLEVVEISKEGQAAEVVDLQAGAATLRVTPDHPVQVPDEGGEAGRHLYMPAGKLKAGDFVMLDSGEPVALTSAETQPAECKVLKIVFKPDLPVAVFSSPSCILSKGHRKKLQVRRAGGGRGKEAADPMDGGASIPDTAAGEYMD